MSEILPSDLDLAERDPANSLENRSIRFLNDEIMRLERRIAGLRFARETIERHIRMTNGESFQEPTPAELRAAIPRDAGGVTWQDPEWRRMWLVIGFALEFTADAIEHRADGECAPPAKEG